MMRKLSHALTLASVLALPSIMAASTAAAADATASPHTVTSNVNLLTNYRFRGIDQTWGEPALQGGADYAHADGWYAGVWGSNVSGNSYAGGSLELDYYAGYNGKAGDLGWTVGGYGYYYPGADFNKITGGGPNQTYDTFEVNAGLSWKWISYKLSYSTTDYFGANTNTGYDSGTKGTLYHDVSVAYPLADDLTLGFHIGRTDVKAVVAATGVNPDYTDYKLSVAKTFQGGWNASLSYVKAGNDAFFKNTQSVSTTAADTRDLNEGAFVLQAGRTF